MTFREHKKFFSAYIYVQVAIRHNRTSEMFENRSRNIVFMAKIILNSVFTT